MGRQVFIPLSDELLYDHPEWIPGPVVPYDPTFAGRVQPASTVTKRSVGCPGAVRIADRDRDPKLAGSPSMAAA